MLIDLEILDYATDERTENIQASANESTTTSSTASIRRKVSNGGRDRESELYTRAWAIYSRARVRRPVQATSIF
ncbi:MAG: hypothetical protein QUS14_13300 [Pyrinomonadaceae bacterium]|nr:hypothetical protein [Pyrinomonadaceae bacterium]